MKDFCILLLIGSVVGACAQDPSSRRILDDETLWPGLEPGPHAVGYRVEHLYDSSRTFPDTPESERPIQISLWYPASSVEGHSRIRWQDYFLSAATEIDFSKPDDARRRQHLEDVREAAVRAGADPDRFQHLLGLDTLAYRDAPAAQGRHPLVIFVPGRAAPAFQNTVAYEYLASAGFVVASFPSVGATSRDMTSDEAGASAQVLDIEFVSAAVRDLAPIDPERVALVGYSWGGLTVTLAAMRGADVDAMVAIDSTLMVKKGHALARSFEGYRPDSLQVPVMLMIADAVEWKERDLSFFEQLSGKHVSLLRFHDLKHGDFGSIIIRFFVHTQPDGGDRDVSRIDAGYATFCRYLLAFLDAHLRDGSVGQAFLAGEPADHGIPAGVVSIERH